MMQEPWFWRAQGARANAVAAILSPLSALYDAARRARNAVTRTEQPPVPVICIGNATLGGTGKTPFALMLAPLLAARGHRPFFLTRGFGGRLPGPLAVDPSVHSASEVGDEPLLLARVSPTIVARDRPAGARLASELGADMIVMDDGFQNPAIAKTFSILLLDGADPGGRLFPAGPYREPLKDALTRADAVVSISDGAPAPLNSGKPSFSGHFASEVEGAGTRVVAFCGIARPERFFAALRARRFAIAEERCFPDHHRFRAAEIEALRRLAEARNAQLITTAKDFVRLTPDLRDGVSVFPVALRIDDPDRLVGLVVTAANAFHEHAHV